MKVADTRAGKGAASTSSRLRRLVPRIRTDSTETKVKRPIFDYQGAGITLLPHVELPKVKSREEVLREFGLK